MFLHIFLPEEITSMIQLFYDIAFIVSIVLCLVYVYIYHKHFEVSFSLIFVIAPIQNLGYCFLARSTTLKEALMATKVIYIGACFASLLLLIVIFEMCHLKYKKFVIVSYFTMCFAVFLLVLSIGYSDLYYKDVTFEIIDGCGTLIKNEYGPAHILFYALIISASLNGMGALIYSYIKKKNISRKIVHLLLISEVITTFTYFFGKIFNDRFVLIPLAYIIDEILYLFIVRRICLYNITDTAIESMIEKGATGFISFDFKYNYLGSNHTARKIFPELNELTVDKSATVNPIISKYCLKWIDEFKENEKNDKNHYKKNDRIYLADVNYLFDGKRKKGYQLVLTDDTKDQKYITLLNKFNTSLKKLVNRKTNHIVEMHNNLIMSMATMVESRDNSTGGHIRRTSECVRILIEEIGKNNIFNLSENFMKNIIKAAPMHDLGKIAVDDVILRKPGKFEPEEFEIMKKHAPEGARIVKEILKCTDDAGFRIIAENVAHYHHERWDGSGYPDGLKEEKIPIEARIMAIADVYDALVSKRVYKESMSFETADSIIMEGMGKHFDKRLEPYYVAARPKLEQYYKSLEKEK